MADKSSRIVVVGLGNPLLTDDTIGLLIVKQFEQNYCRHYSNVKFVLNYSGGFDLMEELIGFDKTIIVDSIYTGQTEAGFCHEFSAKDMNRVNQSGLLNSHGLNLPALLDTGAKCGYSMPEDVILYGIEGRNFNDFSEEPSAAVKGGINTAIKKLQTQLNTWLNN